MEMFVFLGCSVKLIMELVILVFQFQYLKIGRWDGEGCGIILIMAY